MENEKAVSSPTIAAFNATDVIEYRVDKYSIVAISQNRYSVPEGLIGKYIKDKVVA